MLYINFLAKINLLIAITNIYLNLCTSKYKVTQVIKHILHKLSVIEAKVIAAESVYLEKLHAILFVTTSRQNFTPRI